MQKSEDKLDTQDVLIIVSCRVSAIEEVLLKIFPEKMLELEENFINLLNLNSAQFPKLKELANALIKPKKDIKNENQN